MFLFFHRILFFPILAILTFTVSHPDFDLRTFSKITVDSIEIMAPTGSKTFVQLADGSEVFLNHGSKLKYPYKFSGDTREVKLSGEGYFTVAHNPQKPFIVNARNIKVKAVGTIFNVCAYPDEPIISTTLVNGKVILGKVRGKEKTQIIKTMTPGQHVSFNTENNQYLTTKNDIEKYISWKDGRLVFKNDPIAHIATRLSRWYNVEVVFKDKRVTQLTYTATFQDETLEQILDLLKLATPINYTISPSKKRDDGTYSKQVVTISLRSNKLTNHLSLKE